MHYTLNVVDTAIRSGFFQTFCRLLEGSQLEKELRSKKCYTLLAPIDIAFVCLPTAILNDLVRTESQGILASVLSYHVVPRKIMSSELKHLSRARTMYGEDLIVSNAQEVKIDGARLIHTDIVAGNGVIHGIDELLLPRTVSRHGFGGRLSSRFRTAMP
jgi:uncharacterized surface protein with fasciclin (FAS1) repeats